MAKYMAILEANPGTFKGMIQEPQDRKKSLNQCLPQMEVL